LQETIRLLGAVILPRLRERARLFVDEIDSLLSPLMQLNLPEGKSFPVPAVGPKLTADLIVRMLTLPLSLAKVGNHDAKSQVQTIFLYMLIRNSIVHVEFRLATAPGMIMII
jgi:hypothetical protein